MDRRTKTAAATVLLLVFAAGCSVEATVPGPPAAAPATPSPAAAAAIGAAPPSPAGPEPGHLCVAFAAALHSADTTTDTDPGAAYRRATGYLLTAPTNRAVTDGRWPTWLEHRARIEASVTAHRDVEQPPDSSVSSYRAARVTATPVGADGWQGRPERSIVFCTLRRHHGVWRIAAYQVEAVAS